jgi:hypothetical protein
MASLKASKNHVILTYKEVKHSLKMKFFHHISAKIRKFEVSIQNSKFAKQRNFPDSSSPAGGNFPAEVMFVRLTFIPIDPGLTGRPQNAANSGPT